MPVMHDPVMHDHDTRYVHTPLPRLHNVVNFVGITLLTTHTKARLAVLQPKYGLLTTGSKPEETRRKFARNNH